MPNERAKLERRLLGKFNRLGTQALEDDAVLQSIHQIALELLEPRVLHLNDLCTQPAPSTEDIASSIVAELHSIASIAHEQGLSGLQVLAEELINHVLALSAQTEPDTSLTLFGAQDLLRMLHELAVGVNKPPNPEVLLALQGANRL